jgi:hypothetical protein
MGDRKLVIDKGGGVMIHDLDGAAPAPLSGADGLIQPRRRPTCTPQLPDDVPQDPDSPDAAGSGVEPTVVEPPPKR